MTKQTKPKNILNNKGHPVGTPVWAWAALLAMIILTGAIRVRLLAVPLERDEGEYAYAGQLILQGVLPYEQVYNMKMPGIYAAYALIEAVFGQTHTGIHLGLLIINAATAVMIFFLARELFGQAVGAASACAFLMMSLTWQVDGFSANAEHFVILPAMCGIWLLILGIKRQKSVLVFAGAILLGVGFMMKQHGGAFILFGGLYLLISELRQRPFGYRVFAVRVLLFAAGVLLPFGLTCFILWRVGVFGKFWFWTFDYARAYVSKLPVSVGLTRFRAISVEIITGGRLLWLAAGLGLILLWFKGAFRRRRLFTAGFVFFSFVATCPGFYFRSHYFILLLPAAGMLAGIGVVCAYGLFTKSFPTCVKISVAIIATAVVTGQFCYEQRDYLFNMGAAQVSRFVYGANPFPESLKIAEYLQEHSSPDDTIAVIGSEPQIYFYSKRRSATGYVYTYALMENHPYAAKMQQEMIGQIESASPKYLVFVNITTSWMMRPNSEKMIFEWFERYVRNYSQVGVIDILGMEQTDYYWDEKAAGCEPRSKNWLRVFRRNNQVQSRQIRD